MVLNGLPHSHTMINCSHSHLCFLTPGVCANPVWGPFLCDHDKITIWDILLANFWWSQQLLDHESHVHSQDILYFLTPTSHGKQPTCSSTACDYCQSGFL